MKSQMIHWRLRRGCGKANIEIARLTRLCKKEAGPWILFFVGKGEIEIGDFSLFRSEFDLESPPEHLREMVDRVTFAVFGYDDSDQELYEIPGVRDYFAELNCHWPWWSAFCRLDSQLLRMVCACVSKNCVTVKRKGSRACDVYIPRDDLTKFFINALPLTAAVHKAAGLSPTQCRKRLKAVAWHLGLM